MNTEQAVIRQLINSLYDVQKLRIATGNRVVASLRPTPSAEDGNAVKHVVSEYRRITDYYAAKSVRKAITELSDQLSYIKSKTDYELAASYVLLVESENRLCKAVTQAVQAHPLWDAFFKDVGGCGPLMAGVCIAYLDPYKARFASSFWKFAGLDVVDGEGRSRKHTELRDYTASDGSTKQRKGLTYNPVLKTKLLGVLGSSFLRVSNSKYGRVYYDYKHRLNTNPAYESHTKLHKHNMANRYAVKMFLQDLWVVWRQLEGLPTGDSYAVGMQGRLPHHADTAIPLE